MQGKIKKATTVLAIAVIIAALVVGGIWFFRENYVTENGRIRWIHSRTVVLDENDWNQRDFLHNFTHLKTIDARTCELTVQQYDQLRQEFPECRILWTVPFQGNFYSSQIEKLTISSLDEKDLKILEYFPELKSVDAWSCEDYGNLFAFQQRRPLCKVFYDVTLCGENWDCDVQQLELKDVDLVELEEKLQYLPCVSTMHLTGELPQMKQLQAVLEKYPQVALSWDVDLGETVLELDATKLDFADFTDRTPEEIAKLIAYLPALEEVNMLDCGLPVETIAAIARENPNVKFLCDVQIGPFTFRSDAREIDLSGHDFGDVSEVEAVLPCFYNLEKVVMCNCGIPSEEMDALNKRYEDIRFVWSFWIAHMEVRTDDTYFMPIKYKLFCSDRTIEDLKYCEDMICIDIGHNMGVTHCEWAAHMPNLQYLILADSGVRDISPLAGLKNLIYLEIFQTRVKDYSPLLECPALEDLNICYTYGDYDTLTQVTWLKRLWIGNDWKARAKYEQIFSEALPDCEFNCTSQSSTGEGWREGKHYYEMRDILGMGYMKG